MDCKILTDGDLPVRSRSGDVAIPPTDMLCIYADMPSSFAQICFDVPIGKKFEPQSR